MIQEGRRDVCRTVEEGCEVLEADILGWLGLLRTGLPEGEDACNESVYSSL